MKSKNISIVDFYEQLQKEYMCYEIRSKIYPTKTDVEFFKKSMDMKKVKILDLQKRVAIDSVFTSDEKRREVFWSIAKFGGPHFEYRDIMQRKRLEQSDIWHYYFPTSDIKILIDDKEFIGKIIERRVDKGVCLCSIKGEKDNKLISLKNISRII